MIICKSKEAQHYQKEVWKCRREPAYFLDTYGQIYDATLGAWLPFHLWPAQLEVPHLTEWLARDRHALRERVGLEPARQDSHLLAGASRAAIRDRIVQRPRPTSIIQLGRVREGAAQGTQHWPLVFLPPRSAR